MKKIIPAMLLCALALPAVPANSARPSGQTILETLDRLETLGVDMTCRIRLTEQKRKTGTRVVECLMYRRDADDAFLAVMTGPNAEKGNGYLRTGDNLWMYRSTTRIFRHVNRDESIAGTDTKGGDLEKSKLAILYRTRTDNGTEAIYEETLGSIPVYRIEIEARTPNVTYPRQTYWVRRDILLPLKVQSYSLSGTLLQTAYYRQYTVIAGRYLLVKGLFIDEFEQGDRTLLEVSGISLTPIPGSVFSKPYLENLSR